jgi:signal transduction histidine kinase
MPVQEFGTFRVVGFRDMVSPRRIVTMKVRIMKPKRSSEGNGLRILAVGFGLTIALLFGSAYLAIREMGKGASRIIGIAQEQQIVDKLIDDIQEQEAGLSSLFYSVARSDTPEDRGRLLSQIASAEQNIQRTLAVAMVRPDAQEWRPVKEAIERFTRELREAVGSRGPTVRASDSLFEAHEALVRELTTLVSSNYQAAVDATEREDNRRSDRLRFVLVLLVLAGALSIGCAVKSVQNTSRVIERARWQARELSRLSGHVLETQDTVVRRLSRELHDEFGQTLTAIEANLAAIPPGGFEQQSRIEDCMLLVKDAMSNVRELAQLLRPSILDDFGLKAGLEWLADSFHQRTGIDVDVKIEYDERLPDETETHLFRITQEALTNAGRHSGATRVQIRMREDNGRLELSIADDGRGLKPRGGRQGFGMMGMRERMRAADGELHIRSAPNGLTIVAEVPLAEVRRKQKDPNLVGG